MPKVDPWWYSTIADKRNDCPSSVPVVVVACWPSFVVVVENLQSHETGPSDGLKKRGTERNYSKRSTSVGSGNGVALPSTTNCCCCCCQQKTDQSSTPHQPDCFDYSRRKKMAISKIVVVVDSSPSHFQPNGRPIVCFLVVGCSRRRCHHYDGLNAAVDVADVVHCCCWRRRRRLVDVAAAAWRNYFWPEETTKRRPKL